MYCFSHTARYWSKIATFIIYPTYIQRPRVGSSRWNLAKVLVLRKLERCSFLWRIAISNHSSALMCSRTIKIQDYSEMKRKHTLLRENSINGRTSVNTSGTGLPMTSAYWSAAWSPDPTLAIAERRSKRTWNGNSSRKRSASKNDRLSGRCSTRNLRRSGTRY